MASQQLSPFHRTVEHNSSSPTQAQAVAIKNQLNASSADQSTTQISPRQSEAASIKDYINKLKVSEINQLWIVEQSTLSTSPTIFSARLARFLTHDILLTVYRINLATPTSS